MLYDEWEKLLETRFVKNDDVIKSGETVTFNSYLVDIGELCGVDQSTSSFNCQEKVRKVTEISGSSCNNNPQSNQSSVVITSIIMFLLFFSLVRVSKFTQNNLDS